jgi:hypothetical protein
MLPDTQYPITEAQFRAWLEQDTEIVAGLPCTSQACPLFHAIEEITGKTPMMVNTSVLIRHGGGVLNHPQWARDFIYNLDVRYARNPGSIVSRGEALECLTEVER